jgi:hypothetical protein
MTGEINFRRFCLDLVRGGLLRDGKPVPLGNRALDILVVLASATAEGLRLIQLALSIDGNDDVALSILGWATASVSDDYDLAAAKQKRRRQRPICSNSIPVFAFLHRWRAAAENRLKCLSTVSASRAAGVTLRHSPVLALAIPVSRTPLEMPATSSPRRKSALTSLRCHAHNPLI